MSFSRVLDDAVPDAGNARTTRSVVGGRTSKSEAHT